MATGVYKITVVSVTPAAGSPFEAAEFKVGLKIGTLSSTTKATGPKAQPNDVHLFQAGLDDKLSIALFLATPEEPKIGYAEFQLGALSKIPNTRHLITVHSVYRDAAKVIEDKESATLEIEVVYTAEFHGKFELDIVEADLIRDTEAVGKMDPFVTAKIGEVTKRTTTKAEAGKFPKWNESFSYDISGVPETLQLDVQDEDVTSNDLVGSVTLNLRTQGFLKEKAEMNLRTVDILFEGKKSGTLTIKTRFTIKKN